MIANPLFGYPIGDRPQKANTALYPPGFPIALTPPSAKSPPIHRERARDAEAEGNWSEAARHWLVLYDADHDDREAILGVLSALQAQGLCDDAEVFFQETVPAHANHLDFAIVYAQNAQLRSDLDAAISRSLLIVDRFPDHLYGYQTAAILLAAADRPQEGSEVLASAEERFGEEAALVLPSLHVAVARKDWPRAALDLKRLEQLFPQDHGIRNQVEGFRATTLANYGPTLQLEASRKEQDRDFQGALDVWETVEFLGKPTRNTLLGRGRCQRELGAFAVADVTLREASEQYPGDPEIEANKAQVPAVARDWHEAARRWRVVLRDFPDLTAFASMAAQAFARAGDRLEAETVMNRAIKREPASLDLRTARAFIAQVAENWETEVQRWVDAIQLAPDDIGLRVLHEEACARLRSSEHVGGGGDQVGQTDLERIDPAGDETAIPMKEMVKHFESLGDNCEFGVVQRHFGAEPITLFRFAAIDPERLIELLDIDLQPLGDPDHTFVSEMMDEYYIKDDRGYYYMHTFVKTKQVDAERYIRQQVPRIAYLKRNFLSDVRTGEKIYVCKLSTGQITDETLRRLSRSLRRYGNNLLLGGRRADESHPVGSVERLDENILIGYTTQLHGEEDRPMNSLSWGQVMRTVYRLRYGQPAREFEEVAS